ncbi:YihY/virulence factor BrkB family protein [Occallatibacter riparius]|uniref:YihY/virulence factor BrkB family protein n=1 Tax=Occallatibacter riparius TaxID=1002689 RepID=A0A9J7BQX1_9BACT|nr:YihY/virulence factor BrkB family protein [Occallatibacter riparius]UWZ83485.1 YihY/virulence factor BrkB family protein [Occallatibacter riparius]
MPTPGGVKDELNHREKHIWELVALSPAKSLWDLRDVSIRNIATRTWKAMLQDRLFSIAAELGFYFLFALFPALICATTILGFMALSGTDIYRRLLEYMALVVPQSALGMVMKTFNQTTIHATTGKLTLGLLAAVWSASVGISAVQDATNAVYKIAERRSYLKARIQAIGLTMLLICTVTLCLASMFAGDFLSAWVGHHLHGHILNYPTIFAIRICGWILAAAFLALSFAAVYYWAPDLRVRQWHWITPGAMLGIVGWLLASLGFRMYLHFFDSYSVTYGSLGAVVILLMWFYITGLMLLLGAEFNSELEAAAVEARLAREKAETKPAEEVQRITPAA